MRNILTFLTLSTALGLVTGCDSTKEALGLKRERPDETSVMEKRPLTMPPGYGLRPPVAGGKNPAEYNPEEDAKGIVTNKKQANAEGAPSSSEAAVLKKAGQEEATKDENIRDQLALENPDKPKAPGEDLVFWKTKKAEDADAIDPQKEYEAFKGEMHPTNTEASKSEEPSKGEN